MFTGLVEDTGRIDHVDASAGGRVLWVETQLAAELQRGDSIAVNGVCLTVASIDGRCFLAQISPETIRVTSLSALRDDDLVNLERPVRADARLGGHFVLGHVDGVGRIAALRPDAECHWLDVEYPETLASLLVPKGSIAVDGISLTIASLSDRHFGVQIVPFTWKNTTLRARRSGDAVNLETDIIGKYVARLMNHAHSTQTR